MRFVNRRSVCVSFQIGESILSLRQFGEAELHVDRDVVVHGGMPAERCCCRRGKRRACAASRCGRGGRGTPRGLCTAPIRVGRSVLWPRTDLVAWVATGCRAAGET